MGKRAINVEFVPPSHMSNSDPGCPRFGGKSRIGWQGHHHVALLATYRVQDQGPVKSS